jgi:hypothetical protein
MAAAIAKDGERTAAEAMTQMNGGRMIAPQPMLAHLAAHLTASSPMRRRFLALCHERVIWHKYPLLREIGPAFPSTLLSPNAAPESR